MSAQCIIWNRHLPHFSSLHTDSFALTILLYEHKGLSLVKQMQQFQVISDSNQPGGGGGGLIYETYGDAHVSLRGVNFGFWSCLGCS